MPRGNRDAKPRSWTEQSILGLVTPRIRTLIRRALSGDGIGGDAIDHGTLPGLGDDDHTQYLRDTAGTGGTGITVSGRIITADGTEQVFEDVPSGVIDSANDTFVLSSTPITGTVQLFKNGLRMRSGASNDYTISTATITFNAAQIPQTGDSLFADYLIP